MLTVIAALVPSAGILFLFWLVLKSLIEADRRERAAEARLNRATRDADRAGSAEVSGSERSAGGAGDEPGPGTTSGDDVAPGPV